MNKTKDVAVEPPRHSIVPVSMQSMNNPAAGPIMNGETMTNLPKSLLGAATANGVRKMHSTAVQGPSISPMRWHLIECRMMANCSAVDCG